MPSTITLPDLPVALQGNPAPGYSAIDLRRIATTHIPQEGVVGSGDLKVTPGAGLAMNVAAGEAGVEGDSVVNQGRYYQRIAAAQGNLTLVTPPDVTNSRLDQVVLEVKDTAHDGSGLKEGRIRVVPGNLVAPGSVTLDNRAGAAPLPASCIRLADVLVIAGFGGPFVANTHIRDRRPWARGAFNRIVRVNTGANYAWSAGSIDATNLEPRIECSGRPIRLTLQGYFRIPVSGEQFGLYPIVDGTRWVPTPEHPFKATVANHDFTLNMEYTLDPVPAGSHKIGWAWSRMVGTGQAQLFASGATDAVVLTVEETHALSANNN